VGLFFCPISLVTQTKAAHQPAYGSTGRDDTWKHQGKSRGKLAMASLASPNDVADFMYKIQYSKQLVILFGFHTGFSLFLTRFDASNNIFVLRMRIFLFCILLFINTAVYSQFPGFDSIPLPLNKCRSVMLLGENVIFRTSELDYYAHSKRKTPFMNCLYSYNTISGKTDSTKIPAGYSIIMEYANSDSTFIFGYYDSASTVAVNKGGLGKDTSIDLIEIYLVLHKNLKMLDSTHIHTHLDARKFRRYFQWIKESLDEPSYQTAMGQSVDTRNFIVWPKFANSYNHFNNKYKFILTRSSYLIRHLQVLDFDSTLKPGDEYEKHNYFRDYWQCIPRNGIGRANEYSDVYLNYHRGLRDMRTSHLEMNTYYLDKKRVYADTLLNSTDYLVNSRAEENQFIIVRNSVPFNMPRVSPEASGELHYDLSSDTQIMLEVKWKKKKRKNTSIQVHDYAIVSMTWEQEKIGYRINAISKDAAGKFRAENKGKYEDFPLLLYRSPDFFNSGILDNRRNIKWNQDSMGICFTGKELQKKCEGNCDILYKNETLISQVPALIIAELLGNDNVILFMTAIYKESMNGLNISAYHRKP